MDGRYRYDPPLDETAIDFVVNGTRMRLATASDEVEAVRRMAVAGVTAEDAAHRLCITDDTLRKRAYAAQVTFTRAVKPAHWTYEYVNRRRSRPQVG